MSPTDPDAKIARMKDGSTHLAFKPAHRVDLDTGGMVAASIHSADAGDTATLAPTLAEAHDNFAAVGLAVTSNIPGILWPTRVITRARA
jgi:transposase